MGIFNLPYLWILSPPSLLCCKLQRHLPRGAYPLACTGPWHLRLLRTGQWVSSQPGERYPLQSTRRWSDGLFSRASIEPYILWDLPRLWTEAFVRRPLDLQLLCRSQPWRERWTSDNKTNEVCLLWQVSIDPATGSGDLIANSIDACIVSQDSYESS